MSETTKPQVNFWAALDAQLHVIGALILRELHTRYGRDNIGFLWVLAEPMLFAGVIASLHVGSGSHAEYGMDPAPFWIVGYGSFIMFRSIVLRGESTIESNRTLLYHRNVTILDMLLARALLEAAGTSLAIFILLSGTACLGIGTLPQRPIFTLAGLFLLWWFSFGLSMLVCTGAEAQPLVGRLIHPLVYFMLPLSSAFFLIEWIPDPYRTWISWFPLATAIGLIREGQFQVYNSQYLHVFYTVVCCLILTLLGLASVSAVRNRLHLE